MAYEVTMDEIRTRPVIKTHKNLKIENMAKINTRRIVSFCKKAIAAAEYTTPITINCYLFNGTLWCFGSAIPQNENRGPIIEICINKNMINRKHVNKRIWLVLMHEIGHLVDWPWDKYCGISRDGYGVNIIGMEQKEYEKLPAERAANKFARKIIRKHPAPMF